MNGDSIFTIHHYDIDIKKTGETFYLIPFGDIHRFAPLCDNEKWFEFLEWARNKPNCLFLGMGDYFDFMSFSERKAMTQTLHESSYQTIEDMILDHTNTLLDEIEFMRGKLIGLIEGNHYGMLQSGITTTQYMCEKLKVKYLGVSSFIRIGFTYGKKSACIDVWAHHGRGASRLSGGSINTVEQMSNVGEANIYLMGHDHRKSVALKTRLALGQGCELKLSQHKILLGRTGSFLKGYVDGQPSYIARSMMTPTDLGTLKIELTPKRSCADKQDVFYIDLHCSL
jgi:hypothetical protein